MQTILFIGMGGFLGAISRFLISSYMQKSFNFAFPIGTLSVNVLGSFLIGFLALYFEQVVSSEYRVLVITGFLGALTTFSTFSYESVMLLESGAYLQVVLNIALNVAFTLLATIFGMWLFKRYFI